MSNIQTGAERMPHDLSHLGFLAGQIGRLITISTTPVIAGDSFEMDAVGALRLSPLRRGLAIDSTVDIFTFFFLLLHFFPLQLVPVTLATPFEWTAVEVCVLLPFLVVLLIALMESFLLFMSLIVTFMVNSGLSS